MKISSMEKRKYKGRKSKRNIEDTEKWSKRETIFKDLKL